MTFERAFPAILRAKRLRRFLFGAVLLTLVCRAGAQDASPATIEAPALDREVADVAPVTVDGKVLFQVRGISGHSARERAEAITGRLVEFFRDPTIGVDAVTTKSSDSLIEIFGGPRYLMAVTEGDAQGESVDGPSLAKAYTQQIRDAAAAYRTDRSTKNLTRAGLRTLVASVFFTLLVFLLQRLFRWLGTMLERRYRTRMRSLHLGSLPIFPAEQAWTFLLRTLRASHLVLFLLAAAFYLHFVLVQWPWTRSVGRNLLAHLINPLRSMALALVDYIPSAVFLVVLFLVTRYVLKTVRLFFSALGAGTLSLNGFDPDWAPPTYKLVRVFVVALALVVAYPYLPGSDSAAFTGVSVLLGVMLSLGSSSVVSNVMAGYSLVYRRAFKLGDRVRFGELTGTVKDSRLLVTHLRTIKNEEITIPNAKLLENEIVNFSTLAATGGLILHTTVKIGYATPWRQVEAILLLAAERTSGLQSEPRPFVLEKELGDFGVTYEINVYTNNSLAIEATYAELHRNVLDAFNEHGVQIMTPAYEGDPEVPKVVPAEQWSPPPAKPRS